MLAASSAPAKAATRQPDRRGERALEPPQLSEHRAQGRATGHAQHRGVRERVPRQSLERGPRDGQAAARERGEQDARKPQLEHHRGGQVRACPSDQRGGDVARADRRRTGGEPDETRQGESSGDDGGGETDPAPRDHGTRSGWSARASARSASIIRGPGRWTRSPSTAYTRPSRTALTASSRSQPRSSSSTVPCPWRPTMMRSGRRWTTVSRESRGYASGSVAGDALAAGPLEELRDERAAPGRDQRIRPHHVEDARARRARDRVRDGVRVPPHRGHARPGESLPPEHDADALDRLEHRLEVDRPDHVDGQPERRESLHVLLVVALRRGQDQIRPQRQDRLEARRGDSRRRGAFGPPPAG